MEYQSPEQERFHEKRVSLESPEDVLSELNSEEVDPQLMDAEKNDLLSQFVGWLKKKAAELKVKVLGIDLDIDGKVKLEDLLNFKRYTSWYKQSSGTKVSSLTELRPGDHIAVNTKHFTKWWNHMIVTDVDVSHGTVYVVCLCSPDSDPENSKVIFESDCISVKDVGGYCRIERKKPRLRVWELPLSWRLVREAVKYNYSDNPFTPEQVVERARQELGKGESWDLYTMTSEQFASQVKTGIATNEQKNIQDQAIALGFEVGKSGVAFSIKNVCCVFKLMLKLARWILKLSFRNAPKALVGMKFIGKFCAALLYLGFGIGPIIDAITIIYDIHLKRQRLKEEKISNNEFKKYVAQKVSEFITNLIFGGLSLAMRFIPIPLVGVVLSIAVSIVGWLVSKFTSWLVGKIWDKLCKQKTD